MKRASTVGSIAGGGSAPEPPSTYLTAGIGEAAVAGFFRAAAAFHRAAPWKVMPADEALAFSIEELGIRHMAVTTVGQEGDVYGFALFGDVPSFVAFVDAPEGDVEDDATAEGAPPHLSVHVVAADELDDGLVAEVRTHGWEIARPDAIPWPIAVDEDLVGRPMTADELLVSEAVALAVARLTASTPGIARAWDGGEPLVRTVEVETHQGSLAVTLIAPAEAVLGVDVDPLEIVSALGRLEETDEELDAGEVASLSAQLVAEFRASPEGAPFEGAASWAELVMMLGVRFFDATIASLGPEELTEMLAEIIPRTVVAPASEGAAAIAELRAFYEYLDRVHGLEQARECVQVLGPAAAERLAVALAGATKAN